MSPGELLPFIIVGPLIQSSPCLPGGKASLVSGFTILASKPAESFPAAPQLTLSSAPHVLNTPPVDSYNIHTCRRATLGNLAKKAEITSFPSGAPPHTTSSNELRSQPPVTSSFLAIATSNGGASAN
ncbi:hypothetical protein CFP56_026952 [Quercus suber]|uniref:Uncharacterized protein n=1 Tax=Quercus suber TaxID=58331 RepID=A0AAW0LXX9_QUESU